MARSPGDTSRRQRSRVGRRSRGSSRWMSTASSINQPSSDFVRRNRMRLRRGPLGCTIVEHWNERRCAGAPAAGPKTHSFVLDVDLKRPVTMLHDRCRHGDVGAHGPRHHAVPNTRELLGAQRVCQQLIERRPNNVMGWLVRFEKRAGVIVTATSTDDRGHWGMVIGDHVIPSRENQATGLRERAEKRLFPTARRARHNYPFSPWEE